MPCYSFFYFILTNMKEVPFTILCFYIMYKLDEYMFFVMFPEYITKYFSFFYYKQ